MASHLVIVCTPKLPQNGQSVAPCLDLSGTKMTPSMVQLDFTAPTVETPFDYAYASSIWGLAFTFVVGLYLMSKNVGLILALIKGR